MSAFDETDVSARLFGKSECPYCGVYSACLALHRCSTEQPEIVSVPAVDREPSNQPEGWRDQ